MVKLDAEVTRVILIEARIAVALFDSTFHMHDRMRMER